MLTEKIDQDLKSAMLSADKELVEILRSIKSAILYKAVADKKRDSGLEDSDIIGVLRKEKKLRQDALDVYQNAGEKTRADKEKYQIDVISRYLPKEISMGEVKQMVQAAVRELGLKEIGPKDIGKVIPLLKQKNPNIDGAIVSQVIREISENR